MLTALDRLTIYSVLCFISFCALVLRTPADTSLTPLVAWLPLLLGFGSRCADGLAHLSKKISASCLDQNAFNNAHLFFTDTSFRHYPHFSWASR